MGTLRTTSPHIHRVDVARDVIQPPGYHNFKLYNTPGGIPKTTNNSLHYKQPESTCTIKPARVFNSEFRFAVNKARIFQLSLIISDLNCKLLRGSVDNVLPPSQHNSLLNQLEMKKKELSYRQLLDGSGNGGRI